jgi:glycosyltransferase involved in cell wall biosynthesis
LQKTCIIIPCYNEENRLHSSLFIEYLNKTENIDFLFCDDGSTDSTLSKLNELASLLPKRIEVFHLHKNAGKAEAVRQGMVFTFAKNKYNLVGFWDADLATPLSEINNLLLTIENKEIAIASRWKRLGAQIERRGLRHILGRIFSTFASIILKLPVYDTQCGAKIFHSNLAFLFESEFITKWLFDIEIMARYRNKYGVKKSLEQIIEVPVKSWMEVGGSKLKLNHMLKVPLELFKIYLKYNKK